MPPSFRRLLILVAALSFASPQAQAADPIVPPGWETPEIDPHIGLNPVERQIIQDALIWTGAFTGTPDGQWSQPTDLAFRAWRSTVGLPNAPRLSRAELLTLLVKANRARAEAGWTAAKDPNTGFWFAWPTHAAKPPMPVRDDTSHGSDYEPRGAAGLKLMTRVTTADPRTLIDNLFRPAAAGLIGPVRPTVRIDRPDRQVAMLITGTGVSIYVRYDRVGPEWRGFAVLAQPSAPMWLAAPIAAEFSASPDPATPQPGHDTAPVLADIAALAAKPEWTQETSGRPASNPLQGLRPTSYGTAFVVRRDGELLTNAHVVNGCDRLKLADGTELTPLAIDRERDLAVLKAAHGFPAALTFRREQAVDLGETVRVFGFPYYRLVSESLNITEGIVTALTGLRGNQVQFQMSANLQPGNSGGPVLDESGNVIGVSVSVLNSLAVARLTGTMPQGMNYAIRGAQAETFLAEHNVAVARGASHPRPLREVVKETMPLVFPLLCYN